MKQDWLTKTACNLGREIAQGDIDPEELTDTYLKAIKSSPVAADIYARITEDRARNEAGAASKRRKENHRLSLLDGVPISWKDLFDSAGVETEAGTLLLKGRIPKHDAIALSRAGQKGLVCLGKTHMSELAFSGLGLNPVTKSPPCVNDSSLIAGGSSSGAATSVAFGIASAGIGSDTAGSVRVPAAWNDLVGLKTTHGVIPLTGTVPLCSNFDTIGPICRSVEDATMLYAIMANVQIPEIEECLIHNCRFLVPESKVLYPIDNAPQQAFNRVIQLLREAGSQIEYRSIPGIEKAQSLSSCMYCVEAYATLMDEIGGDLSLMFDRIRERFLSGKNYSAREYVSSWKQLTSLRSEFAVAIENYDAVLLPTSPILPPNAKKLFNDKDFYVSQNLNALRNTRIGNVMEVPAVTLPSGIRSAGIMLMGKPYCEAQLLKVARSLEKLMAIELNLVSE